MPVWLIITIATLIVGLVAGFLMTGGLQKPPAGQDEALQVPTTEIGVPLGVLFGTRLIRPISTVWYGNLGIVKEKVSVSGKKG